MVDFYEHVSFVLISKFKESEFVYTRYVKIKVDWLVLILKFKTN